MNATIIIRKTWVLFFFTCNLAACQNTSIVDNYTTSNCNFNSFDRSAFNALAKRLSDTLSLKDYNDLIGQNKIWQIRKGEKRIYQSVGKVSIYPIETRDPNGNKQKVYTKVLPICKVEKKNYVNLYTLHYSLEQARIEVLVLDINGKVISGLTLLKGEINYRNKELGLEQIKTIVKEDSFDQERVTETPEGEKIIKKYTQRADGYFEETISK